MTKQELQRLISSERTAALIVNTKARQGQRLYARALELLQQNQISITRAHAVANPEQLPGLVREAIRAGNRLVIVGGGDGTISSVVDAFAYQDAVLAILPLGTGNSFAQTLGIPSSLDGAIRVIAEGKVADVDLGRVNDDYFANVATVGLSADAARRIVPGLKHYFGPLAYALAGAEAFLRHGGFDCHLSCAEFDETVRTHEIIVANGRYYGITPVADDATVNEGRLTVFMMGRNRLELIKVGLAFLLQRHALLPEALLFSTAALAIEADPSQYVDLDGEVTTRTPIEIAVAPEALRVMVPLEFRDVD